MKVQLFHRQDHLDGRTITILTHVKVMNETGQHLAFAKVTPELLDFLKSIELNIPEHFLNWNGKASCSNNPRENT